MSNNSRTVQLAVIGAGPGGYAAAFHAADLGLSVTLIDPRPNPGGVCSFEGCIPSKALLHVAKVISESAEAKNWGVTFAKPQIELKQMRSWKNDVVAKLTGGAGQLGKMRKVEYIRGMAKFVDGNTLEINPAGKANELIKFQHAILATGSLPSAPPHFPKFSERIMDSTEALEIRDAPQSLLVIGAGYIGLEMGTVYAALGCKVTLVEMLPTILPQVDKDLARPLHMRLEGLFDEMLFDTKVAELKELKNGVQVVFESTDGKKEKARTFDKVLVAVGRKPNSKNLGLENTDVRISDKGFVEIDAHRRTNEPRIFAIGDVAGEPMLAHKASHEGRVAAEVIMGRDVIFDPRAIPAVVFTDPEVCWCGLTEAEAKEAGRAVETSKFPWGASGRAATLGRSDGVTKLVIDPETERILGVGITGPGAGELIAEGVLAIEMGALASDVGLSIHPHPTLSETIMEAADLYYGQSTHFYKPKRR